MITRVSAADADGAASLPLAEVCESLCISAGRVGAPPPTASCALVLVYGP